MSNNSAGDPGPSLSFTHPLSTFVIRIWKEWSSDEGTWRGHIEHLESKKRTGFQDLECMLEFLLSFGLLNEEPEKIKDQESQINTKSM